MEQKNVTPQVSVVMAAFNAATYIACAIRSVQAQTVTDWELLVIDDSKRNDIGNTAKAYAYAHLAKNGPIDADFMTVSPFLGTDSIQPFLETASAEGKGVFVLVKTSNPSSGELSEAVNPKGETICDWLAAYVHEQGMRCVGTSGYSSIGAVVGATFPQKAQQLRQVMRNNFFLVPGFGAQGGRPEDVASCFNEDGLGAVISSSRGVLYKHGEGSGLDHTRASYQDIVRKQAQEMKRAVYQELKKACPEMCY